MTKLLPFTILLTLQIVTILPAQAPSPEAPVAKESPGLLDGFLESLFGESKPGGVTPTVAPHSMWAHDPSIPEVTQPIATKRIGVQDDFDEALKLSQLEQRPLLVIAGAEWCSWCRKLEKELEQADAEPILTSWIVVKIDVDAAPALAEEFEVSALPALRVLSADRRVAAKREGYMPLAELQTWLEEAAPQVDPSLTRVLYESTPPDDEQLAKLIEFLGNRSPSIRQSATKRLTDARTVAAKAVVAVLGNGRLSQRLCAVDILRSWGAPVADLDPWEPDSILTRHLDDLNSWIESNPASASDSEPAAEVQVDPQKIKNTVTSLLLEPDSKRRLLLSEAMSYGPAVIPELRARLASDTDLSDSQRTQLRELLMLNLAGNQTRGDQSTLLTALASLNPDTHRKAAVKILELVEPHDRALVEELAQDADALVRESAVPALERLGLLQLPEVLPKLLNDKSPSVRTAVLREIAESPRPESVELLNRHAAQETDEDLLVYTAKTLGELLDEKGVEETLCSLAKNSSWRVRATALDAFERRGEYRYDYSAPVVSEKVFDTILSAAEDVDPFVKKRATELLPKLMSSSNAQSVVRFLTKRPEGIDRFWADVPQHERRSVALPLSNAASRLLKGQELDPEAVTTATILLTKINPDALKLHLPSLLTSTNSSIRIAALKGTVALMHSLRATRLASLAIEQKIDFQQHLRAPWYPVPESFQTLPALPEPFALSSQAAQAMADSLEPEPIPADPIPAVPTPVAPPAVIDPGSVEPQVASENTNAANRPLSSWLEDWQAQPDSDNTIRNVIAINQLVHEMWMSSDGVEILKDPSSEKYVEMTWLALANLACGHEDSAEVLAAPAIPLPLNAHPKPEVNAGPVAIEIMSWLPANSLYESIKDYRVNWQDELTDDDKALLKAVTVFENHQIAEWLLNSLSSHTLSPSQFANAAELLTRALRGDHEWYPTMQVSSSELQGDPPFKEYAKQVIGTQPAIEWLYQHHQRALSADQRAVLLTTLLTFDYGLGSQSAVGKVASAEKWDREVEVATLIGLAAESRIAADRAVQWLDHPLREVRLLALDRLASPSNQFMPKAWALGVTSTQNLVDDDIPLFFFAARSMPVERLEKWTEDPDNEIAWPAYMLLIGCGEEDLDDWKEDELESEDLITITTALAKAQRSDSAAIGFYRRANDGIEIYQKPILIRLLSVIDNDEVKALIKNIEKDTGYSTFVSPPQ